VDRKLVYEGAGGKERTDRYLREHLNISRERIKEFLRSGSILVNGKTVSPSRLLQSGDEITIKEASSIRDPLVRPECGHIEIIYEDSDIIAVNKPAGIITHPTTRILTGTLVNFLLYHTTLSSIGMPYRPGVVHRLDKETSGAVVFAKNDSSHNSLVRQFQNREVEKEYIAVVQGDFKPLRLQVEFTVSPDRDNRTRMEVHYLRGKKALTVIEVLNHVDGLSVLKVKPVTGRTHQIRITLAHLGYPVIGDLKYGVASNLIDRVALHSRRITLSLPSTGEKITFSASLPADLLTIVRERL